VFLLLSSDGGIAAYRRQIERLVTHNINERTVIDGEGRLDVHGATGHITAQLVHDLGVGVGDGSGGRVSGVFRGGLRHTGVCQRKEGNDAGGFQILKPVFVVFGFLPALAGFIDAVHAGEVKLESVGAYQGIPDDLYAVLGVRD